MTYELRNLSEPVEFRSEEGKLESIHSTQRPVSAPAWGRRMPAMNLAASAGGSGFSSRFGVSS